MVSCLQHSIQWHYTPWIPSPAWILGCLCKFSIYPLYNPDADRPISTNATAIPRCLPVSGDTVRLWVLDRYQTAREHLCNSMLWCNTAIHISFDLCISPNHRTFMAIVGHYLNISTGLVLAVMLGFRRLRGPHSGENQAAIFFVNCRAHATDKTSWIFHC